VRIEVEQITLKALANLSRGFALKPRVQKTGKSFSRLWKELQLLCGLRLAKQHFQSCVKKMNACCLMFPKRNATTNAGSWKTLLAT
jgi:hypothetical protein